MNVINLIGRIIADPELKKTQNGTSVCSFTISVQRPGGAKDENGYYKSDLIRCEAWRNTAEFIDRYFYKGAYIGLTGSLQLDSYTDRDSGKKLTAAKVVVNNAYFTSSKESQERESAPAQNGGGFSTAALDTFEPVIADGDGDLPF